jgi:hypothetical protein
MRLPGRQCGRQSFRVTPTSSVFEGDASATNQGPGTTINTPTVTTINNDDAILNCASWAGCCGTWTEINGFYYNSNAGASYNIQSTAGTIGPDYTQTSASWVGLPAAFKQAGAAAPSCKGKLTLLGIGCRSDDPGFCDNAKIVEMGHYLAVR